MCIAISSGIKESGDYDNIANRAAAAAAQLKSDEVEFQSEEVEFQSVDVEFQ